MEETTFDVKFLGVSYPTLYVQQTTTAGLVLQKLMQKTGFLALDTETARMPEYAGYPEAPFSPHMSCIRLLQLFDGNTSYIFDLKYLPLSLFAEFLTSKSFVAHSALFDLGFIKKAGILNVDIGCTLLAYKILYHALYADDEGFTAKLGDVAKVLLKTDMLKLMGASDWSVTELSYEQLIYASLDVISLYKIAEKLAIGLQKQGLLEYYNLCKKALHPISTIQLHGIKLDVEKHKNNITVWRDELITAKKEVEALTGLKSLTAHTLAGWLEDNLDKKTLLIWPRTDKGKLKTDAHAFADFAFLPIVKPFAAYQKKQTLCSTFGTNLFTYINPATQRIHSSYFICGARTGRLSSSKPNCQNLPAREKSVRESFIAEPGNVLVCADYGQVELRCAAEISQDQTMLAAFRDGVDLHRLTASKISNKTLALVTEEERQLSKCVNFGLLFGLGYKKFSHYAKKSYGVEVTDAEAHEAVQIFRDTYPGYREWQLNQANEAAITKRVVTPSGKWRRLPDDNTFGNSMNHPVQGAAAEIMMCALIRVDALLKDEPRIWLVNTVHDEIVLECLESLKELAAQLLKSCMIGGYRDVFPKGIIRDLVVIGSGKTWAASKSKENRLQV